MRITSENIDKIKNPLLKGDAEGYVKIYESFIKSIEKSGVKVSKIKYAKKRDNLLKLLKEKGAEIRNEGKSVLLNAISPSCVDCRTGNGAATYILTLACNRDCYFCTNKNQEDYEGGVNKINDVIAEFKRDNAYYKHMKSVALTGGEPLLFPTKCVEFIKKAKQISKDTQTRIYTNGDLATTETLKVLKEAGLDEIRFGIKPDEEGNVEDKILKTIKNAVEYIPRVMVEMPIVPGTLEKMKELIIKLDKLHIFGINILEFLYPWINPDEYSAHKYKITQRPYKVLYGYSYAGGIPVAGSEVECLELLLFCAEEGVKMGVHYCSLENKLTSQIYQLNSSLQLMGTEYFSPNDFFIKTVKGYGEDVDKIKNILDENGCEHYIYNKSDEFIEFSPKYVKYLKNEDNMELGLTYQSLDFDGEGRKVLRELQIDLVNAKDFDIDKI